MMNYSELLFADRQYRPCLVDNLRDFILSLDGDEWEILIWDDDVASFREKTITEMSNTLANLFDRNDVRVKVAMVTFTRGKNILRIREGDREYVL